VGLRVAGHDLGFAASAVLKLLAWRHAANNRPRRPIRTGDLVDASVFAPASAQAGDAITDPGFLAHLDTGAAAAQLARDADSSAVAVD